MNDESMSSSCNTPSILSSGKRKVDQDLKDRERENDVGLFFYIRQIEYVQICMWMFCESECATRIFELRRNILISTINKELGKRIDRME
jgi:hypothetical protein